MSVGLICLLIADDKKRSSTIQLTRAAAGSDSLLASVSTPSKQVLAPRQEESWQLLIAADPDLAKVATTLEQFGSRYVDQLAVVYTAFNRKDYLPIILDMIVSADQALSEAMSGPPDQPAVHPVPETAIGQRPQARPNSSQPETGAIVAIDEAKSPFHEQVAVHDDEESMIGTVPAPPTVSEPNDQASLRKLFDRLIADEGSGDIIAVLRERASGESRHPKV